MLSPKTEQSDPEAPSTSAYKTTGHSHSDNTADDTEVPAHPAHRTARKAWTNDEKLSLFYHVINYGQADWEMAVPLRTGSQARQTWKKTLEPFLIKAIHEHTASHGKVPAKHTEKEG